MSRRTLYKLLIVGLTAGLVGAALLWWSGYRPWEEPWRPFVVPAHEIPGTELDLETVHLILPGLVGHKRKGYDPVAIVRPFPDQRFTLRVPEHPDGRVVVATNNFGMRRDEPTAVEASGPRVLVLGDSQTYGIVHNDETFAAVLGGRLSKRLGEPCEVLDAGVAGTGPYEYVGSLEKFAELEPDVVVAVLYTGNDFSNALRFADFYSKRRPTPEPDGVHDRLVRARGRWRQDLAQGGTQAYGFLHRPGDDDVAVAAVIDRFLAMARLCAGRGFAFVAVVLPTKFDVDLTDARDTFASILGALDMTEDDYALNRRMGLAVAARLEAEGIPVVDPWDAFRRADDPLYWRKDHHLNIAGHALLAELLEPTVAALIEGAR